MLTTKKWVVPAPAFFWATLGVVLLGGCTPPGPRALLDGARLIGEGRYEPAVERLKVAVRLLPQNAQAWNHLGLAYHGVRQFDLAIRSYEQALVCNRNLSAARFNLGCLYAEQNNLSAAIDELKTYTLLQPQAIEGWLQLGLAQLRARQFAAAEATLNRARQLEPNHPQALNDLGLIQFQRNRPREAYAYFSAALQHQPRYAPALLNVAIISDHYFKNHAFALEKYRAYLAVSPQVENRSEVEEIVRQLTLELHPPLRPAPSTVVPQATSTTNAPPLSPATAPPRRIASTTPPAAPAPTNTPAPAPATNTAKTAPPVERTLPPPPPKQTTVPEPFTTLPVEVVRLPDELPIRPPIEAGPEPKSSTTAEPTASPKTAPPDAFNPPSRVVPLPERPGFFQRLNPGRWFRRNTNSESAPAVSPSSPTVSGSTRPPAQSASTAASKGAPAESQPPRSEPVRYVYRAPAKPAAGDRSEAQPFFVRGAEAHRDGRLSAAVATYRQAVTLDPAFFEAQYNLGLAAYELGELELSLSAYETALAIQPESADARYNFALALQRANYPRDAAAELEKLLAERPDETRAHLTLANLYARQLGQPALARAHYLKVLALEPQHAQANAIRYWLSGNSP
jgi:tetratricopeptide (TPR) repeat protein